MRFVLDYSITSRFGELEGSIECLQNRFPEAGDMASITVDGVEELVILEQVSIPAARRGRIRVNAQCRLVPSDQLGWPNTNPNEPFHEHQAASGFATKD